MRGGTGSSSSGIAMAATCSRVWWWGWLCASAGCGGERHCPWLLLRLLLLVLGELLLLLLVLG